MSLTALEAADSRELNIRVAGPAALLVAKLHKIQDRSGTARTSDKDALDVLRLLRGTTTEALADRFRVLLADPRSSETSMAATELLQQQFSKRAGVGIEMTMRAMGALGDPKEIAVSCEVLATDLLRALGLVA